MESIALADNGKQPSSQMISMMWRFVTKDIDDEFEQWVYSSAELIDVLSEASYLMLISIDYRSKYDVFRLRESCFNFVVKFHLNCICMTFPINMILYPFREEAIQFKSHVQSLNKLLIVENFSGQPPIYCSRWYHPAELCQCRKCGQYYLMLFEEDGYDYYIFKLEEQEANIILDNPDWPNNNWPQRLSNWDEFNKIKFVNWDSLYRPISIKSQRLENLMLNYEYNGYYSRV